jgi:hypothetical protein
MPERKPFLLRLDPELYSALQIWAKDELRSLNAQIEFLLRRDLQAAKRLRADSRKAGEEKGGKK